MVFGILVLVFGLWIVFIAKAVKIVQEGHRLVVFRLGKLFGVREPGIHILMPFIDSSRRIDLQATVPNWRALSKEEIEDRVISEVAGQAVVTEWINNGRRPL